MQPSPHLVQAYFLKSVSYIRQEFTAVLYKERLEIKMEKTSNIKKIITKTRDRVSNNMVMERELPVGDEHITQDTGDVL